jgi:pimeloyl-ACP methyl ester carboxylesterase
MGLPPQTAARRASLLPRLALAVLAGLAIALAIDVARDGGPRLWLAAHGLRTPYVGAGQRVDLGTHSLYLDCRGSGTPTVILESGAGEGAGAWGVVFDDLAATTRTCVYDRAGRGSSDPRGLHTLEDAATDLRAALDAAGERGPFVVVGHSLGGTHARVFSDAHRSEVVGVVLVDSFDPIMQTTSIHPLLGDLRAEYERRLDGLRDIVERAEDLDWTTSEDQLGASSIDGLPVEVLRAPRADRRLDRATNAAITDAWRDAYLALSPGRVRYEIASGAGHIIQADRPDLVIAAVRRLVDAARA